MAKWIEVIEDGLPRMVNFEKVGKISAPDTEADPDDKTVYIEFESGNVSDISVTSPTYEVLRAKLEG